jgi:hypothetical protein
VTTDAAICDRCGNAAQHLFPDSKTTSKICSNCYEALRLHHQGAVLSGVGIAAIVLGAAILLAIVVLLLTY